MFLPLPALQCLTGSCLKLVVSCQTFFNYSSSVDFLFGNGYLDLYFHAYRAESYWFAADMCHNLWKRNDLFYSRNPSGRMGYNIPVYSRGGYMCYNNNHPPGRFLLEVQRHEVCPLARVCCK